MMQGQRIAVIGAGGFAREVAWLIAEMGRSQSQKQLRKIEFAGFLVSDLARANTAEQDLLGSFDWLEKNPIGGLAMGIGNPETRLRLSDELKRRFPGIPWPVLIHPSVLFHESCRFGEGATLCAGTIATVNVEIAEFAMVNLSCTIGHEAKIGAGSVINPLTAISGGVTIGRGVLIGTHAAVQQYISIGDHAVVGSGAMVHQDVAPHTTVVGVPAKPKRAVAVSAG